MCIENVLAVTHISPKTKSKMIAKEVKPSAVEVGKVPTGQKPKPKFRLYVRSGNWIKDRDTAGQKLKEICPRIIQVNFPRQKYHSFAHVTFKNAEQRELAYQELLKLDTLKVFHAKTDDPELMEKLKTQIEERRATKKELKKAMRKAQKQVEQKVKIISNKLLIKNLPAQATLRELKKEFPEAIEVKLAEKPNKKKDTKFRVAIVTLPTPADAKALESKEITLHGSELKVCLQINKNLQRRLKKRGKKMAAGQVKTEIKEEEDDDDDGSDEVSAPPAKKTKKAPVKTEVKAEKKEKKGKVKKNGVPAVNGKKPNQKQNPKKNKGKSAVGAVEVKVEVKKEPSTETKKKEKPKKVAAQPAKAPEASKPKQKPVKRENAGTAKVAPKKTKKTK